MRRACFVLLLSLPAWAEEPSAELGWAPGQLGTIYPRLCPLGTTVPEGVKVPADLEDGRFLVLDLANGVRVAVAHEALGKRRGLWVDSDADGDLAEETPVRWGTGTLPRATDAVRVPLPGEDEPISVVFLFQRGGAESHDQIGVFTQIRRSGWIVVADRQRPVALVDGNGDLRFDDVTHDRAYLDLDGDGQIQGSYEALKLGEPVAVGREGFVAEVPDPLGRRVVFRRVSKAPAPRRLLVPPVPPPIRHTGDPPAEPFAEFAARFDDRKDLLTAASYGTPEAFRLLLQSAEKGRAAAVEQMGYAEFVAHEDTVARLARAHREPSVRRAALAALHAMGAPGRAGVYEAILRDGKESDLVEDAARHLAYIGTAQSRATLLSAFRAESRPLLRLQVFQGGTGGDPEGPPKALVDLALEDESETIRYQALEKSWRMRDPKARSIALEIAQSHDNLAVSLVTTATRVLASDLDKGAVKALLSWAERGTNPVWLQLYESLRLARDPEVTRALLEGMREGGARTRGLCADLLARIEDPAIGPALLKAIANEEDADVARRILRAMGSQAGIPVEALLKLARRPNLPSRSELLATLARVGGDDPAVVRLFLAALTSKSTEERILALDVAAKTGDASFLPGILQCLDHEAWQVRLAAVEALRGVRARDAVPTLIGRLGTEESVRVRAAISETLFGLTGQDLLDSAEAWRAWWKANGAAFAVPPKPPVRKVDEGGTVARFYGLPVRTERVCFVLDRSDSMEGIIGGMGAKRTKMEVAVEQLEAAVKRLPDRARVNVVLFDSVIEVWKKALAPLTETNRAGLRDFVKEQEPRGQTNIYDALEAALLVEGVDSIFLLSDGAPTAGAYREDSDILLGIRRLNQTRRIAIHTVSVGRESDLLRRLAEESGGRYARR